MTKIIVEIDALSKYSKELNEDAQEFQDITKRMQGIVNSLNTGWQGMDSRRFISNANSYIAGLNVVRDSFIATASSVSSDNAKYSARIDEFNSALRG